MGEFLDQRFSAYRKGFKFHAAVITHPDEDHYFGFKAIFDSGKIKFDNVYHSGLVERRTGESFDKLGGLTRDDELKPAALRRAGAWRTYGNDSRRSPAQVRAARIVGVAYSGLVRELEVQVV